MKQQLLDTINKNFTTIAAIIGVLGTIWAFFKDKIKEIKLFGGTLKKSKSVIRQETITADDTSLEILLNRQNKITEDYVKLSEEVTETQKENYYIKLQIEQCKVQVKSTQKENLKLLKTIEEFNKIINKSCINNCLKPSS